MEDEQTTLRLYDNSTINLGKPGLSSLDICHCVLFSVIGLVIIVTNSLSLIVFIRSGLNKQKHLVALLSLTIADLCVEFVLPPMRVVSADTLVTVDGSVGSCSQLVFLHISTGVMITSVFHLPFIAFDRFVAVLFPLKYGTMLSKTRLKILVVVVWTIPLVKEKLENASKSGSVEISQPITLLTLNVILRCAFSSNVDVQRQGKSHPYVQAVLELSKLLVKRAFNPLMHVDFIYSLSRDGRLTRKYLKVVHDVSETVIAERKRILIENPDEGKRRYLDFLDILLLARDDKAEGLADREIRDEVDTFLFRGHDTTSSAIMWILYEIARSTNYQQRCREEIDQFLEDREVRDVQWDDGTKMPFTTQCIKEAMRLHSPVPFIARELTKEFELNGVKLPPGTFVDIFLHLCHHNEEVWGSDHDEFKPERFDPDKMEHMDPFAFVPFSAGPRNCIGQNFAMHEIKVVVAKMLDRFVLTLDPSLPIERKPETVTRAAHGIKLYLKPRH